MARPAGVCQKHLESGVCISSNFESWKESVLASDAPSTFPAKLLHPVAA